MDTQSAFSDLLHKTKYRQPMESFRDAMTRIAGSLSVEPTEYKHMREILLDMRFLPGGRIQAAIGVTRPITAFNCFVSRTIEDSMRGIMRAATEAAETLRSGGGIGYDFSTLRPQGDLIAGLGSTSSGPVSFMSIFDAVCGTICSAGHRRGAQMGVLRVDHPDIEKFVRAKRDNTSLTNFNISVGVTDEFMEALAADATFDLRFGGRRYATIKASYLWEEIMRSAWDYAEPGVLFIDTMNRENNLKYCETIAATNPCSEQPLPPFGACLLGSINLARYVQGDEIDTQQIEIDIPVIVSCLDRVFEISHYPLPEQKEQAITKRRMGIGVTGVANALEAIGHPYGSDDFCIRVERIMGVIRNAAYSASAGLAETRGPFAAYNNRYLESPVIHRLPGDVRDRIEKSGIRNSHLISIAPTGTISLCAKNVSSGIEPVFAHETKRAVHMPDGIVTHVLTDYGVTHFGHYGRTASQCSIEDHLRVLFAANRYVDSGISKTVNVPVGTPWEDFKAIYERCHAAGVRGCATAYEGGKRMLLLSDAAKAGGACTVDPESGLRSCDT